MALIVPSQYRLTKRWKIFGRHTRPVLRVVISKEWAISWCLERTSLFYLFLCLLLKFLKILHTYSFNKKNIEKLKQGLLSVAVCGLLIVLASLAEQGPWGVWTSVAVMRGLSSHGVQAYLSQGMWNPLGSGIEPVSPAGRFLTTGPPGMSKKSNVFLNLISP